MVGGNRKERSDISATLFPPTSATLLFHTFQIQRQRHRKRQIQSAYIFEATLLPPTSAATLLFHTFRDDGINFPVDGPTVTPHVPAAIGNNNNQRHSA